MLGTDIVNINRISNLKKKDRFIARFFTQEEIKYIAKKNNSCQTIAGIFSAKEAVSKAFKTGIGKDLGLKDIEILHKNGAAYVNLDNEKIKRLLEENQADGLDISISHDGDYAISQAILFKSPSQEDYYPPVDKKMAALLPKRDENFNKYDYGNVLIIGGKKGMHGSVSLCSLASMRTGAGLSHVLVPESIESQVSNKVLESIIHTYGADQDGEFADFDQEDFVAFIKRFDAIAFGPGIGKKAPARTMLKLLLTSYAGPLIVDADGISLLSDLGAFSKENVYITPHEGEFARISGLKPARIREDRLGACQEFLERCPINLLLKGKDSIIINKEETYINKSGSSALATAGSGDSLTGILVALLARKDHLDMMKLAAYIHGLAGDYASQDLGEDSVIASDIIGYIPKVIKNLRKEEANGK